MNDDKIFIQDFEGNSKKGLIIVDDDSDVIIEQDALICPRGFFSLIIRRNSPSSSP